MLGHPGIARAKCILKFGHPNDARVKLALGFGNPGLHYLQLFSYHFMNFE